MDGPWRFCTLESDKSENPLENPNLANWKILPKQRRNIFDCILPICELTRPTGFFSLRFSRLFLFFFLCTYISIR